MKTIINNTQEDYVDFEVAKLLKEKGFISYESQLFFADDGFSRNKKDYNMNTSVFVESCIERPTIQLAVNWLKENYGKELIKNLNYSMNDKELNKELLEILKKL